MLGVASSKIDRAHRAITGVRTEPSNLVDIAPTIIDFLGLPGDGFDGKSLGRM